ncbi:MAG: hypothetical protein IKK94_05315, partial [Clostridia bacterium]|nr:hypothetical protein [Clostridia bacterium]
KRFKNCPQWGENVKKYCILLKKTFGYDIIYMEEKRFRKNDNSFVCANCGKTVEPKHIAEAIGYQSLDRKYWR